MRNLELLTAAVQLWVAECHRTPDAVEIELVKQAIKLAAEKLKVSASITAMILARSIAVGWAEKMTAESDLTETQLEHAIVTIAQAVKQVEGAASA